MSTNTFGGMFESNVRWFCSGICRAQKKIDRAPAGSTAVMNVATVCLMVPGRLCASLSMGVTFFRWSRQWLFC